MIERYLSPSLRARTRRFHRISLGSCSTSSISFSPLGHRVLPEGRFPLPGRALYAALAWSSQVDPDEGDPELNDGDRSTVQLHDADPGRWSLSR
jgi:hypothetical protein